jgi:acyl transferase domain-containing protein
MDAVMGSDTAVFMGTFFQDYTDMLLRDPDSLPLYHSTSNGQSRAMISNRISYIYDLKGPSVTIDTACSSSLVALHLACQSIRTGEAKQAVVGGANLILGPEVMMSMSMLRFLSPDGRSYSFDSRANGYARGEGVGCLVVKPLADALRDGDAIRAVLRNTGANQDGKTSGITLPSRDAQEQLIRRVYSQAQLDSLETGYVEAHGTGTPAGDPIEAAAISSVFCGIGKEGQQERMAPLPIGSVKSNVGHLEGASGIASMVKCILMLEKRCILPSRNFETANPRIPMAKWNIRIPVDVET